MLAVPRTAAGISELHGSWAIEELRTGEPVSSRDIEWAVKSLNAANGWVDSAPRWSAVARLHYAQALLASRASEERQAELELIPTAQNSDSQGIPFLGWM